MLARILVRKNPITKIGLCDMELHRLLITRFLPTMVNCKSAHSIPSLNHRTGSGQWANDVQNTLGETSKLSLTAMNRPIPPRPPQRFLPVFFHVLVELVFLSSVKLACRRLLACPRRSQKTYRLTMFSNNSCCPLAFGVTSPLSSMYFSSDAKSCLPASISAPIPESQLA